MQPRYAKHNGQHWAAWEDRLVLEAKPGTIRDVAVRLQRTTQAVTARRKRLRREAHARELVI